MTFEEIAKQAPKTTTWQFTFNQAKRNLKTIDSFDYICGNIVKFTEKTNISNETTVDNVEGFLMIAKLGIVIICPDENVIAPIIKLIYSRDIKTVEVESKLFGSFIRIRTDNSHYIFKVDKKELKEIDKALTKARSNA